MTRKSRRSISQSSFVLFRTYCRYVTFLSTYTRPSAYALCLLADSTRKPTCSPLPPDYHTSVASPGGNSPAYPPTCVITTPRINRVRPGSEPFSKPIQIRADVLRDHLHHSTAGRGSGTSKLWNNWHCYPYRWSLRGHTVVVQHHRDTDPAAAANRAV